MNDAIVTEYVELSEQIAAEVIFSERAEQRLYDRLDQLWYVEMSEDDRVEVQDRLRAKAQAWSTSRRAEGPS